MEFKALSKEKTSKAEAKVYDYWEEIDVLNKSIEKNKDHEAFVFYDGPATANGMPGIHHAMAKVLKDTVCKYQTMKGKKVLRKVGWDTHGLPVEVAVEKELGFSGKQDIEKYGIEKFNKKCKETVMQNEKAFTDFTHKLGQFIDTKNAYITYNNSYIETEWYILKKMHEDGLIYDGYKIMPYCSRCGTGLSSHEVAQGYQTVSVNSVYVLFKLKEKDEYFVVWTTTPWTLFANVALCVKPDADYVKIKADDNTFIMAKYLVANLFDHYEILEEYKGKDLERIEYEPLIKGLDTGDKKAFYVTMDDYVTTGDGTGIVHIAPAFGEDDYNVARKYDLPVINPVKEDATYLSGPWKGKNVLDKDLELEIIKYLKDNHKLFKKQKIDHEYPHCWRCKTPLLYYSKPGLYIKVTAFKDEIIKANKEVKWTPEYVGEKRFGNWLENLNDWNISRNRYWGTPIPLYKCECGHEEMIGSIKELQEKAITKVPDNIDLHRPFVDDIKLKCPKCGKEMTRIPDVMDCWFDSGSMPFAQNHYPFENEALFKEQFPADFISEGIDQTRGWFYSLLVISTYLTGKSPYKTVLVNDLLLDKNGQKMHKSRGNAIEPFSLIEKYGADAIRWYMLGASPVWTPLKFDEDGVVDVSTKFFNTLKNVYNFFSMYANIDKVKVSDNLKTLDLIDKWLLSRYNNLVKNVTNSYEAYDLTKAVKDITYFVLEDLSNWYIRRNRDRFWQKDMNASKEAVYNVTYYVLKNVCKLMAPVAPFLPEEIYRNLTGEVSVHLADFPVCDEDLINNSLEADMDTLRKIISMGRSVRENAKIKVRIPLSEIILPSSNSALSKYDDLIKEELNIKKVIYTKDIFKYMDIEITPNFKEAGKLMGKRVPLFKDMLSKLDDENKEALYHGNDININLEGDNYNITSDLINIKVKSKEGFDSVEEGDLFTILNTHLTDDLINEGLAREMISKIQNMRKEKDFDVEDRIHIKYEGSPEFNKRIKDYKDMIKAETLGLSLEEAKLNTEEYNLNDFSVKIEIKQS